MCMRVFGIQYSDDDDDYRKAAINGMHASNSLVNGKFVKWKVTSRSEKFSHITVYVCVYVCMLMKIYEISNLCYKMVNATT